MKDAKYWIENLNLQRHPEGGFYKEVYRSSELIAKEALPKRFKGNRCFSTSIYFLLEGHDFSAFHRIKQDEVWHFYEGSSLTIHKIDENGHYAKDSLGKNFEKGESLQVIVKAGTWFAAEVDDKNSYTLVGCTVAPGFDFEDFEMASHQQLLEHFQKHSDVIQRFTRES